MPALPFVVSCFQTHRVQRTYRSSSQEAPSSTIQAIPEPHLAEPLLSAQRLQPNICNQNYWLEGLGGLSTLPQGCDGPTKQALGFRIVRMKVCTI